MITTVLSSTAGLVLPPELNNRTLEASTYSSLLFSAFFPRSQGFYFNLELQRLFKVITTALAAYSMGSDGKQGTIMRFVSSAWHGSGFLLNPNSKAKRVVEQIAREDLEFNKVAPCFEMASISLALT